ncbi:hypothetical protein [Parvularcula lutaonensis]|uniref:Lipoprotein n=1 Tax=Parvularcula lutaonensis TaxID=491923 RepID=A0ABV7MEE7_9PROT|nr:hypothetical protein [Parvularcula lutaonensis]GGY55245.1 hypothetical protein GCM10007148_26370 [Parvularcula lutaonensis]
MKPGILFWIVGVLALLFNGYGCFDYFMTVSAGTDYLASQGWSQEQIAYWEAMPAWRVALWAIGVFSGLLAAILFLMRKAFAVLLFAIGPVVFVLNLLATLFDGGPEVMGASYYVASMVVLAIIVFFWWYARRQKKKGVLA